MRRYILKLMCCKMLNVTVLAEQMGVTCLFSVVSLSESHGYMVSI